MRGTANDRLGSEAAIEVFSRPFPSVYRYIDLGGSRNDTYSSPILKIAQKLF
jgi:hypothetical protein